MATKKTEQEMAAKADVKKARDKAARKERPVGQQCNSKLCDIITDPESGFTVKTYGTPLKKPGLGTGYIGVITTSVLMVEGKPVGVSTQFVPGNLYIKTAKGHGSIKAYNEESHEKKREIRKQKKEAYKAKMEKAAKEA